MGWQRPAAEQDIGESVQGCVVAMRPADTEIALALSRLVVQNPLRFDRLNKSRVDRPAKSLVPQRLLDDIKTIGAENPATVHQLLELGILGAGLGISESGTHCVIVFARREHAEFANAVLVPVFRRYGTPLQLELIESVEFASAQNYSGGICVQADGGQFSGTLGGWMRTDSGYVGVSANHVPADFDRLKPSCDIVHLPDLMPIAELKGSVQLDPAPAVNLVDFAWCVPKANIATNELVCGRQPSGDINLVQAHQQKHSTAVWLCACDRTRRTGSIKATGVQVTIGLSTTAGPVHYIFDDVIAIDINVHAGDSGALVLNDQDRLGALLFARAGRDTAFAAPWQTVMRLSGLQFV